MTTYAHAFQHFVQDATNPRLLGVNNVLYQNLKLFEPNATEVDIPSEVEANIVSKRVAEAIFGPEAVKKLAQEQIRQMYEAGEHDQTARWMFFRDVSSSTNYDLLNATVALVNRYRTLMDFGYRCQSAGVVVRRVALVPGKPRRQSGIAFEGS